MPYRGEMEAEITELKLEGIVQLQMPNAELIRLIL